MVRVPLDEYGVYRDSSLKIYPEKFRFSGPRWCLYNVIEKGGSGHYAVHKQGNMEARLGGAIAGKGRELAGSMLLQRRSWLDLVLTKSVKLRKKLYCYLLC